MSPAEQCPRTETISALIDNELGDSARAAFNAHVAGCAACAPVLAEFQQLHTDFAALPEVAPGKDFAVLVDRRIATLESTRESKPAPRLRRLRWWQIAPVALGGVISLSVGVYLGSVLMLTPQITAQPATLQMAAFTAIPPGALCPALQTCNSMER